MDSPAPGEVQRSGAAPKKDAGAIRGRPSRLELFHDLAAAFKAPGFWLYGAWIDTSLRHRSQALGAFWTVSGTLAFVLILGTLYSQILLGPGADSQIYYAHIAVGFVLWTLIQQSLQQSTMLFKKNNSMIQNGYVKYVDYVLRMFTGHLISVAYNLLIVVGAIVLTPVHLSAADFVLFLTVPLFIMVIVGVCLFLSIVAARYPDISEIMQTVLRLFFFLTPIIWMTSMGKGALIGAFIYLNPFYYLIEIIRGPLVYNQVPWLEIMVVAGAIPLIWLAAALAYARAKPYIPLWI